MATTLTGTNPLAGLNIFGRRRATHRCHCSKCRTQPCGFVYRTKSTKRNHRRKDQKLKKKRERIKAKKEDDRRAKKENSGGIDGLVEKMFSKFGPLMSAMPWAMVPPATQDTMNVSETLATMYKALRQPLAPIQNVNTSVNPTSTDTLATTDAIQVPIQPNISTDANTTPTATTVTVTPSSLVPQATQRITRSRTQLRGGL